MSNKVEAPTNVFVQHMQRIASLEEEHNYQKLFQWLGIMFKQLNPSDKKKHLDLFKKIRKYYLEILSINGRNHNHTTQLRAKKGFIVFNNGGEEAQDELYSIFWTGGYITKAGFGSFFDPSRGKRPGENFENALSRIRS